MRTMLERFGFVGVIVSLSVVAGAQEAAAPHLVLSQDSWDFGEVWHREKPQLTLVLKNEGTADLKIHEVKSNCGCTVAQPARKLIPAGEFTEISIRFITDRKDGKTGSKITIKSNDPQRPTVVFKINGFVKRALTLSPRRVLEIRSLDPSAGQTGHIRLENKMSEPMKLEVSSNTLADVLAVEIKEIAPGLIYELLGRTKKDVKRGLTRGNLTLSTGLSREATITIPVGIQIVSRVEVHPPVLYVRSDTGMPAKRRLTLHYYGKAEFGVTSASCNRDDVSVRLGRPAPPGGTTAKLSPPPTVVIQVTIDLPPGENLPAEGMVIEFVTTDPEFAKLEVPITTDIETYKKLYEQKR